jgi:hypothetical protein
LSSRPLWKPAKQRDYLNCKIQDGESRGCGFLLARSELEINIFFWKMPIALAVLRWKFPTFSFRVCRLNGLLFSAKSFRRFDLDGEKHEQYL